MSAPSLAVHGWQIQVGEVVADRILDLREPASFDRGHLAGSSCLPYNAFQDRVLDLVQPGETVLVVDPGGARAAEMATWLRRHGVQASYLEGGLAAWTGALERTPRGAKKTSVETT